VKRPAGRTTSKKPKAKAKAKAIVVGTDFSSASADALTRATDIARETGATLHIVHASRRLPVALARSLGLNTDERAIGRTLEGYAEATSAAGATVRTHHVHGGATNALRATCRDVGAALVVVGARGRAVPDATLGSTAERLTGAGSTPVLLVRRKVSGAYRDVVIAADAETDLRAALAASRVVAHDARLSVLHAFAAPFEPTLRLEGASAANLQSYRRHARREAVETMTPLLEEAGLDPSALAVEHGDARRVLSRVDPRTLIVIHRSRSLLRHALVGSVSRWLLAYGTSDVLLV